MLGETATVFKLPLCLLIPQHLVGQSPTTAALLEVSPTTAQ